MRFDPRAIARVVVFISLCLIVLHLGAMWLYFHGEDAFGRPFESALLLDLDHEASLPTWWQQTVLLAAAISGIVVGSCRRSDPAQDHRYWIGLGLVFLFLSIDEGSEAHERLIEPLRDATGVSGGIFWFAWVIPAIALLLVFGVVFLRFWWRLPARPRSWMALGGILFVSGALGAEMLSGALMSDRPPDYAYSVLNALEEGLEMLGAAAFLYSLLLALESCLASTELVLGPVEESPSGRGGRRAPQPAGRVADD